MKPGQIIEVDSLDDIMALPSNSYGLQNMLGGVTGMVGNYSQAAQQQASYRLHQKARYAAQESCTHNSQGKSCVIWHSFDSDQIRGICTKCQRIFEEIDKQSLEAGTERRKRVERRDRRIRELKKSKARKCFAGAIVCLATAVFFLSVNLHTEAHDYNTSLLVSLYWFMTVVSVGFTFFLCFLGSGYTE